MKDIIKTILYEWKERKLPEVINRGIDIESFIRMPIRKIIAISGFRRVGKTYLLFGFIKRLLKRYSKEEVIYINFEDERIPFDKQFLTLLLPTISETFNRKIKFLFLDEIHIIPGWSKWVRRIYDTENINIFITGSSSKLGVREIPTELRGRALNVKVHPLSFKEFLKFKREKIDFEKIKYLVKERAKLNRLLEEYIYYGGMPEVVLSDEEKKTEILQEYYRTVLRRDIIDRFRIKNQEGLSALLLLLLNSKYFSVSKTYKTLKSMNYEIGKGTLQRYISYIEDSYFVNFLQVFSPKIKNRMQTQRKIYFIDNGFITSLSIKFSKNWGRLYENFIFNELKRKNKEVFYWKNTFGKEVDFAIVEGFKPIELLQVCYEIDEENIKREERALISASNELYSQNLKVITKDFETDKKVKGKKIKYIPFWKWLLGSEEV